MHVTFIRLLAVAFASAGLFNAIGTSTTRSNFVRWGYPAWWCRVTGGLEISAAILVAIPATRAAGLILCALILAAAALTILRHREFSHLAPIGCFAALLLMASRIS
ncbi:DoxX family protein [Bradyrhizobium monzae]|uniref:DoxX family protein n=1 Tax=Bradyrhizobium sp. Oc8 TaxID=2876780 RepID=UPI001F2A87B3|nr:DoxX family protein [Bradyrhizobium sp. Oc8]